MSFHNPLTLHAAPVGVSAQKHPTPQHVFLCICPETTSELEMVVVEEAELVEGMRAEVAVDAYPFHCLLFVPV